MAHGTTRLARALAIFALTSVISIHIVAPAVVEAARDEPRERGSGGESGALIVKLKAGVGGADAMAVSGLAGALEIGRVDDIGIRVLSVPARDKARARQQLLANPHVLSVEEDGQAQATGVPNDPLWSKQWFARKVRGPAAWDLTTGGGGPIIAILDTGVNARHADLRGRIVPGWNFVANSSNTNDNGDHGTPAAGVAAAAGNNGVGVAGICWKCRIMPVKVLNANGSGTWSNVAAGIVWATKKGARVINLSLGGPSASTALRDAVKYAISKGVVVVAAAGNAGSTSRFYPAAYPNVLGVAGTTSGDKLYSFSNRGSWVRVGAPGCTWTTAAGGKWRSFCGTSAAAPVVSGVAGLIASRTPGATRYQIEQAITGTAVRIGSVIGGGRVDAASAVRHLAAKPAPTPTPTPTPTPKPTPTPTPTPTPAPVVPDEGTIRWSGTLDSSVPTRSKSMAIGGDVEISVSWSGTANVKVTLLDASGRLVAAPESRYSYAGLLGTGERTGGRAKIERWLTPGTYGLRISASDGQASFSALIEWEQ